MTTPTPRKRADRLSAFMGRVHVSLAPGSCWIWNGARQKRGYGNFWNGERIVLAHRYSYSIFNGEIPEGMLVCHRCDVTSCVNPAHLFLGTDRDNLVDCYTKKRRVGTGPPKGTCWNAHLTPEQAKVVKLMVANRDCSLRELSNRTGISWHVLKDISRGRHY